MPAHLLPIYISPQKGECIFLGIFSHPLLEGKSCICCPPTRVYTHISPSSQSCVTIRLPTRGRERARPCPSLQLLSLCFAELSEEQQQLPAMVMEKEFLPQQMELVRCLRVSGWVGGKTSRVKLSLTARGDAGAHSGLAPHSGRNTLAQAAEGTSPGPHCRLLTELATELRSLDSYSVPISV